jgi:hypothetical protein
VVVAAYLGAPATSGEALVLPQPLPAPASSPAGASA